MTSRLENQLRYAKKQTAYAWAKYYEELETRHDNNVSQYNINNQVVGVEELPQHLVKEIAEYTEALKKEISCPICFDVIDKGKDLSLSSKKLTFSFVSDLKNAPIPK